MECQKIQISLICIYLSSIWLSVESQINVALDSEVSSCNSMLSKLIVDGDLNISATHRTYDECEPASPISLKLKIASRIHYVVIYEGIPSENSRNELDYFNIELLSEDNVKEWCGEFPMRSIGPIQGKGMRVNCKSTKLLVKFIQIHLIDNIGFSIAEIEAYSFGNQPINRGCFKNFDNSKTLTKDITFESCSAHCVSSDLIYMAIRVDACYCSDRQNKNDELPSDHCNIACPHSDAICGGETAYSVYVVNVYLPYYVGCKKYEKSFSDSRTSNFTGMTISHCFSYCRSDRYVLLQGGSSCKCENSIDERSSGKSEDCNSRCSGDPSLICGGSSHVSIYKSCSRVKGYMCYSLLRCLKGHDHYGVCQDCEAGYSGTHCIKKDFVTSTTKYTSIKTETESNNIYITTTITYDFVTSTTNYISIETETESKNIPLTTIADTKSLDVIISTTKYRSNITKDISKIPVINQCPTPNQCIGISNAECKIYKGKQVCDCISGFNWDEHNLFCKDINECIYNPCDTRYSFCNNTIGTYRCQCKAKFYKAVDDICTDNIHTGSIVGKFSNPFVFALILPIISLFIVIGMLTLFIQKPKRSESFSSYSEGNAEENISTFRKN